MAEQIPFVDYLVLGEDPHLVTQECSGCGARFFDRRNACAGCSGTDFKTGRVATQGVLRSFTIVAFAALSVAACSPFIISFISLLAPFGFQRRVGALLQGLLRGQFREAVVQPVIIENQPAESRWEG